MLSRAMSLEFDCSIISDCLDRNNACLQYQGPKTSDFHELNPLTFEALYNELCLYMFYGHFLSFIWMWAYTSWLHDFMKYWITTVSSVASLYSVKILNKNIGFIRKASTYTKRAFRQRALSWKLSNLETKFKWCWF